MRCSLRHDVTASNCENYSLMRTKWVLSKRDWLIVASIKSTNCLDLLRYTYLPLNTSRKYLLISFFFTSVPTSRSEDMWQTKSSRWSSPLSFLSSWWPPRMGRPRMASVLFRISSPTKLVLIPLQDSLKVAWTMSQYILGGQQPSIVRQVQEIVLSSLLCVYSFINCYHLVLYFMLCWTPTEVWHDKLLKKKDR